MDPDLVRLLLVVLGVALVAGIYLWDRYKRAAAVRPPRRVRERPGDEPPLESFTLDDGPDADTPTAVTAVPPDPVVAESAADAAPAPEVAARPTAATVPAPQRAQPKPDRAQPAASAEDERPPGDGDRQLAMDLSFDAHDDGDYLHTDPALRDEVERMIIVVNLAAKTGVFNGAAIATACAKAGLEPGEMSIYHRLDPGSGRVVFSMASMVEPGSFPIDDMQGFTTPGLSLFTQLPGARDGLSIYNEMLSIGEQLASQLKGELRDERHNKLTRQMQEHTREAVIEHRRRLQLARSRH